MTEATENFQPINSSLRAEKLFALLHFAVVYNFYGRSLLFIQHFIDLLGNVF